MTDAPGAWVRIPDDDTVAWQDFENRFSFRPSTDPASWPAIREPVGSLTVDLSPAVTAQGQDLNQLVLESMLVAVRPGVRFAALDWFHYGYWFEPHLARGEPWLVPVFPNGDYRIFLTQDLSTGLFAHPWERTLCVFGEPLVAALAPRLTALFPVSRDHRS